MKQKFWTLTAVCLFILLAALLRAYHLDHFSFWIDEALTPLRTSQNVGDIIAGRTFIQEAVSQDTHPPLYYLLVYITRLLWGESDYAYRYFSLLMGVLLVSIVFQLGRELFGRQAGVLAALLVAINPLYVWYSQEARMYTLLVLLGGVVYIYFGACFNQL
jgi:mannosyltransferase